MDHKSRSKYPSECLCQRTVLNLYIVVYTSTKNGTGQEYISSKKECTCGFVQYLFDGLYMNGHT